MKITVHVNSPLLDAGVILADLPGLQDTNHARVKATENYLFRCDHFFIVSDIARVMTDESLKHSLLGVLRGHISLDSKKSKGKPNFTFVCTKSDFTAVKGLQREIKKSGTDEEKEELGRMLDAGTSDQDPEMHNLLSRYRSNKVRRGLQSAYKRLSHAKQFEVFAVSNVMHEAAVRNQDDSMAKASGE